MRLSAFQVKNFRSVKDSGRCEISAEDVAVLVGQNEAGKSSLLEALMAFDEVDVHLNDIRSDGSRPSVMCEYEVSVDELDSWINKISQKFKLEKLEGRSLYADRIQVFANWAVPSSLTATYRFECPVLDKIVMSFAAISAEASEEYKQVQINYDATSFSLEKLNLRDEDFERITESWLKRLRQALIEEITEQLPPFVLFNDASCLLPSTIDISGGTLEDVAGKAGAANFLTVAGLDLGVVLAATPRHRATMLTTANKRVTIDFQKFWTQAVGGTQKIELECTLEYYGPGTPKQSQPYLVFYISEANDKLYPSQRSKGVRWFLSFFLQLWAAAKTHKSVIFLLDEPGSNLHSKAQQDVLAVIERSCVANQIVYSTHSPDLIRVEKLGRVLAVQREDSEDNASPTTVISAHKLSSASVDTMSVVYRAMGADFSRQQVIQKSNNVLLEEISALYYLKAFSHLFQVEQTINFLPSTGATNIPMVANLLTGWGIEFIIVLDDDNQGRGLFKQLLSDLFFGDEELASQRMLRIKKCDGIEDLFSVPDFHSLVLLHQEFPKNKKNSLAAKSESKRMLAYSFWCRVEKGEVTLQDLADETIHNGKELLKNIADLLQNYPR